MVKWTVIARIGARETCTAGSRASAPRSTPRSSPPWPPWSTSATGPRCQGPSPPSRGPHSQLARLGWSIGCFKNATISRKYTHLHLGNNCIWNVYWGAFLSGNFSFLKHPLLPVHLPLEAALDCFSSEPAGAEDWPGSGSLAQVVYYRKAVGGWLTSIV